MSNALFDYLDAVPAHIWPVRLRAERAVEEMADREADAVRSACIDLHSCSARFLKAAFEADTIHEGDVLSQAAGACSAMACRAQHLFEQREAAERAMEHGGSE